MRLDEASVLIVDDEPVLRLTFSILLRQQGATVHVASDGLEALDVLQVERIDVMLTDKQMPRMDGVALLHAMQERGIRVPSILFVNSVDSHDPEQLARLGVVETVSKPLHPERLQAVLRSALDRIRR